MRTFKGAKICFRGLNVAIDCTIRNWSSGGACLEVVSQNGIPDTFELVLDSNKAVHPCRVTWRKQNRLGVQFE